MSKNQSAAAPAKPKAPRAVPPGTVSGPKGRKLVDAKPTEGAVAPIAEEQRQGERRAADAAMEFNIAQLTSPAAHTPTLSAADQKAAEYQAELAKLAEKFGQPAPAAPKAAKPAKNAKNDVVRPADGTVCARIWSVADRISLEQKNIAAIAVVKADKELHDVNDHTIKTQYARWRKYNGFKGRLQTVSKAAVAGSGVVGEYPGVPTV